MPTTITITGASDDLIEVEGDIVEEFSWYSDTDEDMRYLACSDGTLLSVRYDKDGIWRFNRLVTGTAQFWKVEGDMQKDTNDQIQLTGDVYWVVFGTYKAIHKN